MHPNIQYRFEEVSKPFVHTSFPIKAVVNNFNLIKEEFNLGQKHMCSYKQMHK